LSSRVTLSLRPGLVLDELVDPNSFQSMTLASLRIEDRDLTGQDTSFSDQGISGLAISIDDLRGTEIDEVVVDLLLMLTAEGNELTKAVRLGLALDARGIVGSLRGFIEDETGGIDTDLLKFLVSNSDPMGINSLSGKIENFSSHVVVVLSL
jgi:hypothetical protein